LVLFNLQSQSHRRASKEAIGSHLQPGSCQPDKDGSDTPGMGAPRSIETRNKIHASMAHQGNKTKKKTVLRIRFGRDQGLKPRRSGSAGRVLALWIRPSRKRSGIILTPITRPPRRYRPRRSRASACKRAPSISDRSFGGRMRLILTTPPTGTKPQSVHDNLRDILPTWRIIHIETFRAEPIAGGSQHRAAPLTMCGSCRKEWSGRTGGRSSVLLGPGCVAGKRENEPIF
jgi:hypothetical protein